MCQLAKENKMIIRMATLEDAESILRIYEPYILNTEITFEYERVPLPVFQKRMEHVLEKLPWLVCCIDDIVVGYAYCSPHMERAAFAWDCECSVYLSEQYKHKGIASSLYQALFQLVKKQGYYKVYSLICVPNDGSVGLHIKYDFTEVGTYYNTAYKLGKWRDLLVMEKNLQEAAGEPKPVLQIHQLDQSYIDDVLLHVNLSLN